MTGKFGTPVPSKVVFSEEMKGLAHVIGQARCNAKSPHVRVQDSGYHSFNSDRAFPHIIGVAAEIAYSVLVGVPIDKDLFPHGDTCDFNGIEVKASTWQQADIELKIKHSEFEKKKPLAYVLARVDLSLVSVEFVGSISRDRFTEVKYSRHHKFVDNYCVYGKTLFNGLAVNVDGQVVLHPFLPR